MPEVVTAHAAAEFLPHPSRRRGVALCLSGGGFRAALFHLGALARLNELGILSRVDTVTAVSGGSIFAAHLATHLAPWPRPSMAAPEWNALIAEPFRRFTASDLRTGAILRRAWPWNWFRTTTGVRALEAAYAARLTDRKIVDLPATPRFVFCATDMAFGVNWVFAGDRIGDYKAGYTAPPPDWPLARAVAASSCFPPVFDPLPIDLSPAQLRGGDVPDGPERDALMAGLRLSDGGLYDNMGLEPVWKDHETVLVSDGGSIFTAQADRGLVWRLERYVAIQGNQAEALRKRWLVSSFATGVLKGTYWGIGSAAQHYQPGAQGYSLDIVRSRIANIRTDLDAFSAEESGVLENHGYLLADVAIRTHAPALVAVPAPLAVPHPELMDAALVRTALEQSSTRKLPFGRR